jgi:hypothetical protein
MNVIGHIYDLNASPHTQVVITPSVWESGWVVCGRNIMEVLWTLLSFLISAGHGSGDLGYPQLWHTLYTSDHITVVPPYPQVIRSKTYRGYVKPRIIPNAIYNVIFV